MRHFLFFHTKIILKVAFCVLCIAFLIFSPNNLFKERNFTLNLNEFLQEKSNQNVVLTIYHIETFEGGSNSRAKYLERVALQFNKENKNCFLVVKTLLPDQLAINISNGNLPDIYSFGTGVGEYVAGFLQELENEKSIRKDLQNSGQKAGNLLAYPYILSGYALITNSTLNSSGSKLLSVKTGKKSTLGLSCSNGFTNAFEALNANSIYGKKQDTAVFNTSYEAYVNFAEKNSVSLLGTARDVARVKNREQNGKISSCEYEFLGGFSDLIQYVGVVNSGNALSEFYAKKFAKYLISQKNQNLLSNFGLFSVLNNKIYEQGYMSDFENVLLKPLNCINAFESSKQILLLRQTSFEKVFS